MYFITVAKFLIKCSIYSDHVFLDITKDTDADNQGIMRGNRNQEQDRNTN